VPVPGEHTLVAFIIRAPGLDYLTDLATFGPNFYREFLPPSPTSPTTPLTGNAAHWVQRFERVPMHLFLDFAIGAAECCEILHHGKELVHGEVRNTSPDRSSLDDGGGPSPHHQEETPKHRNHG